jgi:hypothetical protein
MIVDTARDGVSHGEREQLVTYSLSVDQSAGDGIFIGFDHNGRSIC